MNLSPRVLINSRRLMLVQVQHSLEHSQSLNIPERVAHIPLISINNDSVYVHEDIRYTVVSIKFNIFTLV